MSIYTQELKYYIYAYLRLDGTPYYIGKGQSNRCYNKKQHTIKPPNDKRRIIIMESGLTNVGALALERFYIRWYGRKNNETGILRNLTDGGEGTCGVVVSEDLRKIRKNRMLGEKNPFFNQTHTEGVKEKLREIRLGSKLSQETKNKIKEANTGRVMSDDNKLFLRKLYLQKWKVISPTGDIFIVNDLPTFCVNNNLNAGLMRSVANPNSNRTHHKKWKCEKCDEKEE